MLPNTLPVAALAAACVTAAAVGGYFAVRDNAVVVAPQAAALESAAPTADPGVASRADRASVETASAIQTATSSTGTPPARRSRAAAQPRVAASAPRASTQPDTGSMPADTPPSIVTAAATVPVSQTEPPPAASVAPADYQPPVWHSTAAAQPVARELVVAADSVVGLRLDSTVSSEQAIVEDRVEARVVRDVRVDDERAIPEGTRLLGSVMTVERGGKFKERAYLGIRFHTLVLNDGTELPVSTETIYRYGDAVGNKTAAKIGGGAVAGAILGAIMGGSKGAAVGATSGAGAGTAVVMAGDRSEAVFAAGTELTVRILAPIAITLED